MIPCRAMRLFLLALVLLGQSEDRDRRSEDRAGGRSLRVATSSAAAVDPYTLQKDYEWPSASNARMPEVTSDLTALCYVGAVTGSTTAWECRNYAGTSAGTVTDPGTCTVIDSLIPGVKAIEITGACAPTMTSASMDTMFAGAHTVIIGGYGRAAGAPSDYNMWFDAAAGLYRIDQNGGVLVFQDYTFIGTAVQTDKVLMEGWGIAAQRWDGTLSGNNYSIDSNRQAKESFANASAHTLAPWSGEIYYFGTRAARDLHLNGPVIFYAFYNTKKSDAFVKDQQDRFWGIYNSAGRTAGGTNTGVPSDNTAVTGNLDMPYSGGVIINASGLTASVGHQNKWAADALDLSTDTDVGAPTVNANTSSGPFAVWKKAAECDELVDADAAVLEGKIGASYGTTAGPYNASVWLKAGLTGTTRTKAQLKITVAGGTGSTTCNITGLTSTAARYECRGVAAGGGITSIKASILVGNVVGDTGSIQVCQRQLTATINMEPSAPTNTATGHVNYRIDPVADGWPNALEGGKYEFVHTPLFNPDADWASVTNGTYYVFDAAVAGSDHTIAVIYGYTTAGRLLAVFRDNLGAHSDITIDGVSLTAGSPYATALAWQPASGGHCNLYVYQDACGATPVASCHATTLLASDLTGTAVCPGNPDIVSLADRNDSSSPSSLILHALRVYSLPAAPEAGISSFATSTRTGMGTACACANVTGTRGEVVTVSRASTGWCTKGNETTGIVAGDLVECAADKPRIGTAGGADLSFSVWDERTNSTLRSQAFDNAAWLLFSSGAASPTVTANAALGPDNTMTAERLQVPATTLTQYSTIRQLDACAHSSNVSGGLYVRGVSGSGSIDLCVGSGTDFTCAQGAYNATTWTRVLNENAATGGSGVLYIGNTGFVDTVGVEFGAATRSAVDVYIWQADCQVGVTTGPPITTAGTTATRAEELITTPRPSGLSNTQGCHSATFFSTKPFSATRQASAGSPHPGGGLLGSGEKVGQCDDVANSVNSTSPETTVSTWTRIAAGWKTGDNSLKCTSASGVPLVEGATASGTYDGDWGGVDGFTIGSYNLSGLYRINGNVKSIIFDTRQTGCRP